MPAWHQNMNFRNIRQLLLYDTVFGKDLVEQDDEEIFDRFKGV